VALVAPRRSAHSSTYDARSKHAFQVHVASYRDPLRTEQKRRRYDDAVTTAMRKYGSSPTAGRTGQVDPTRKYTKIDVFYG